MKSYITYPTEEKRILGLNGLNHDATATLIHGSEIRFAGHTERYSEIKFDENINKELLNDADTISNLRISFLTGHWRQGDPGLGVLMDAYVYEFTDTSDISTMSLLRRRRFHFTPCT